MKKVITLALILTSSLAFSQTYQSNRIISIDNQWNGFKTEPHTIIVKDSIIQFDDIVFKAVTIMEVKGSTRGMIYQSEKGTHSLSITFKGKNALLANYSNYENGVIKSTVCHKPKKVN